MGLKVLVASSEIYPYSKTGGLGDFAHGLLKYLNRIGVQAFGISPLYKGVDREKFGIKKTGKILRVFLKERLYEFEFYTDGKNYFLYNPELFDREHIYGPPGEAYHDNDLRFGAFSWAVSLAILEGLIEADIIHSNDWQTALIPLISKEVLKLPQKHVFTIHNLAYQGIFGRDTLYTLNLPEYLFTPEGIEYYGNLNFMKAGIIYSDRMTTVSPTYAYQITTPEYGEGLDGLIRKYAYKLRGILNGIDYEVWNPETDPYVDFKYSAKNPEGKHWNKKKLCEEMEIDFKKPLFIFINRLTKQKGVEIVLQALPEMAERKAYFIFLGSGEYEQEFLKRIESYPNIKLINRYDEVLSRRLYGAGDFVLMPSLFEPCGLTQMIGMRYGCIPVVRETGGLADTVIDLHKGGYGITFLNPRWEEFLCAVDRAIELHGNTKQFNSLRKRVMELDFSAERMAREYLGVYEECLAS